MENIQEEKKSKKKVAEQAPINQEQNSADAYIAKLNDDLAEQKKKASEYYDTLQRNMAEFDNFKKRMSKEREGLYLSVVCEVVEKLLPILDNFEKAINTECKDKAYKDGIDLINRDLQELLKAYMVEPIEDIGATFNPDYHEAVLSCEDSSKGEKEIVEVYRKGYKIKEKVVRHSLVKVAN